MWWDVQKEMGDALEEQFSFPFEKLNVGGTAKTMAAVVSIVEQHRSRPTEVLQRKELEIVGDLAD